MTDPAVATACPPQDELARFSRGDLAGERLEEVVLHLEVCGQCLCSLGEISHASDDLLSDLRQLPAFGSQAASDFSREIAELEAKSSAIFEGTIEEPLATAATVELPARLGEYAICSVIGRGGMGTVYRAVHLRLDKTVALKVLSPQRLSDKAAVARFEREMRAVGKLSHPNLVAATDAGEFAGDPYLVMEFVEGIDVARLVKGHGPLSVADACEIVRQAALGLQYAHARELVHRDIKPSNLLLTLDPGQPSGGLVKVADMGLALVCEPDIENSGATTTANLVVGSLDYMAPEQADDAHHVDHRADLYSLGCTLYELLAGRPPFAGAGRQTRLQKLKAHAAAPVPSLAVVCSNLPAGLEPIIQRLLAKGPEARFASAAELATSLQPFCAGASLRRLLDVMDAAPDEPATIVAPPARSRRTRAIVLGCVGALLSAAVIYVQTDRGTVEIESEDDDVEVRIEQNGNLVTILDRKQNKQVRLRSGVYEVKLGEPDSDLALNANGFTLSRGGKEIVTVKRQAPSAGRSPFAADEARRLQARWARHLGTAARLDDGLGIELALVPPGEFLMHPGYQVRLSKPYYLAAREITRGQFRKFVEATRFKSDLEAEGRGEILRADVNSKAEQAGRNWRNVHPSASDDFPVTCLTHADVEAFCAWLGEREKKVYRLPTEAEWVWACRAGTQARFPSGDDMKTVDEFDWHDGNSGGQPHPVAQRKPNAWGFYDMNGNAVEWCRDWYMSELPQAFAIDPTGPEPSGFRVLRGGSFIDIPFESTLRGCFGPRQAMSHIGFRVCREL